MYNVMLISGVQRGDSFKQTHIHNNIFFSLIGYCKLLNIVPCDIQWVLVG